MAIAYLFAPAHERRKVDKAAASGTDAIVLDLEDGVAMDQKGPARAALAEWLRGVRTTPDLEVWVRVNGSGDDFAADLDQIDWTLATGAILSKAEHPAQISALERAGAKSIILLVESAVGLGALGSLVAASRRVERLALGTWDLSLDLGLVAVDDPDDTELMWQLRGDIVVDSRRLGLQPPIDGVHVKLEDDAGLRAACVRALRMGFAGKLLVHPRQIAIAQEVFGLDHRRVELARKIVDAYEQAGTTGRGVIRVNGRMVDRPMVEFARATIARWTKRHLPETEVAVRQP
jgi:citrate lyase subunit beta/citryl-CoA lyase